MVNINFGRSKSKIVIFTRIIFAIELEFAKSAKFTAHKNFALYGKFTSKILLQQSMNNEERIMGKISTIIKKYYFHPKTVLKTCNLLPVRFFVKNISGGGHGHMMTY